MNRRFIYSRFRFSVAMALLGLAGFAGAVQGTESATMVLPVRVNGPNDICRRALVQENDGDIQPLSQMRWPDSQGVDQRTSVPQVNYIAPALGENGVPVIQRENRLAAEAVAEPVARFNPMRQPEINPQIYASQNPVRPLPGIAQQSPLRPDPSVYVNPIRMNEPQPPMGRIENPPSAVANFAADPPPIARLPPIQTPSPSPAATILAVRPIEEVRAQPPRIDVPQPLPIIAAVEPPVQRPPQPPIRTPEELPRPELASSAGETTATRSEPRQANAFDAAKGEMPVPILSHPRINDPGELIAQEARGEIDPINAVILGSSGNLPPSVQLTSEKVPAAPKADAEVIPLPAPVAMNIETSGIQGPEPFLLPPPRTLFAGWFGPPKKVDGVPDRGIGYERVALAPFVIDITQPQTLWSLRIDMANNWRHPDTAEYFFARPAAFGGRGPALETSADAQDVNFISEMGNNSASARTTIPVRIINGEVNGETAGMGDMHLTTKVVLLSGERLKLTQFLDNAFPTGSVDKGIGTGHVAMEPGLLASYRWSDETYIHSEVKYLFPLPTSPGNGGTIFTWGFGISHLLYDGDTFAVIPTAELVCYSIFNASETIATPIPHQESIDNEVIPTLHFGVRVVSDRFRDIGTVEWGLSAGFNLGSSGFYEELVKTEIRVMY